MFSSLSLRIIFFSGAGAAIICAIFGIALIGVEGDVESRFQFLSVAIILCASLVGMLIARRAHRIETDLETLLSSLTDPGAIAKAEELSHSSTDEVRTIAVAIKRIMETLSEERTQRKKLERIRSEFLSNVSHELRTPIFTVQGFLETLLSGAIDDPAVNKSFVAKALAQSERLNALLNDLIDISRIESGEMRMSFRYFDITSFLRDTVESMQHSASAKHIVLLCSIPSTEVIVFADKERLEQVVTNLLSNAIKYTDDGGRVEVKLEANNDEAIISVQDTGIGIAPEHLPRIFERFYRVGSDRSRKVGGTGLGLAIVKHIVEAHSGTVHVESSSGKGTTFTVTFKTLRIS